MDTLKDIFYGTMLLAVVLAVRAGLIPDMAYGD